MIYGGVMIYVCVCGGGYDLWGGYYIWGALGRSRTFWTNLLLPVNAPLYFSLFMPPSAVDHEGTSRLSL